MKAPAITLVWHDGGMTTGSSWRDVEDAIRSEQPRPFTSRHAFREEMRRRSEVWTGEPMPTRPQSSRTFINQLANAGMFLLITEENHAA